MKADFSLFWRFGSVYGDGSEASTMTTYRFRINDGDITGGEGRGGGSPEPAYNETKASILRRRNTMAKMIHEEEQAAIQVVQTSSHHLTCFFCPPFCEFLISVVAVERFSNSVKPFMHSLGVTVEWS